jgi:hypothetical protein
MSPGIGEDAWKAVRFPYMIQQIGRADWGDS